MSIKKSKKNQQSSYYERKKEQNKFCPSCSRMYSEFDIDSRCCSKCGFDAEKKEVNPEYIKAPDLEDYMSGDADLNTGMWI